MIKTAKYLLSFKDKFKPSIKKILEKYNENIIKEIIIMRKPINKYLRNALNILSVGNFEENINKLNYDKIYHLFMIIILDNNIKILIEKNERVNIEIIENNKFNELYNDGNVDKIKIDINDSPSGLDKKHSFLYNFNLNQFINTSLKYMGNDNFFIYSSYKWNCQNFIYNILLSNNLMKKDYENFIMQNIEELFKNMNYIKPISDILTTTAAIGNYILSGGKLDNKISEFKNLKLHTILFPKKYYTIEKAKKWLDDNNYKNSKMTEQKNYYRFQQLGNQYIKNKFNVDKYYTIKNKKLKIKYIIGYH